MPAGGRPLLRAVCAAYRRRGPALAALGVPRGDIGERACPERPETGLGYSAGASPATYRHAPH
jgi:hypothetical protein